MASDVDVPGARAAAASGTVLLTLASGQFLMALDSSVMNVSIATVAQDLGTTVTGIQTAITLYMLVMACLMITGGKIGQIMGRKRAFALGCIIYGTGSFITAISPNLTVLLIGWSLLEGVGAALIMPAIVGLVASNFGRADRPRAYGLVAAAAAIAVALGPLIGGLFTTYASWRWVFAGEVIVVLVILLMTRRLADAPPESGVHMDLVGTGLSALGLGLIVFGVLRAGSWGFVIPKPEAPVWLGLSPVFWLILGGGVVLLGFLGWERRRQTRGEAALVDPAMLGNKLLRGGLTSFFYQYLLQSGLFYAVPLFLSVALGLSAIETGVRILPLSLALLLAAVGVPKFFPHASPRRVVQLGFGLLFVGIVTLIAALEVGVGPEVVTWPMLLAGLGIGALASQLGSVTVSAVPDEQTGEVGGLQNTVTFLGAAIGTALAGAVLISGLTTSFFTGIEANPDVPQGMTSSAQVELAAGVPFVPDDQLSAALADAGVTGATAQAIVDENEAARLDGLRASLSVLALISLLALFFSRGVPTRQPGVEP
ncbi:MAG TPA: MFS transporter [Nocardioidaceae bacterium]|jgi:MFS family permease|nr:MFS transporter [Nocardioidaceae bacterium]